MGGSLFVGYKTKPMVTKHKQRNTNMRAYKCLLQIDSFGENCSSAKETWEEKKI